MSAIFLVRNGPKQARSEVSGPTMVSIMSVDKAFVEINLILRDEPQKPAECQTMVRCQRKFQKAPVEEKSGHPTSKKNRYIQPFVKQANTGVNSPSVILLRKRQPASAAQPLVGSHSEASLISLLLEFRKELLAVIVFVG
jgi:hypothetical protein